MFTKYSPFISDSEKELTNHLLMQLKNNAEIVVLLSKIFIVYCTSDWYIRKYR